MAVRGNFPPRAIPTIIASPGGNLQNNGMIKSVSADFGKSRTQAQAQAQQLLGTVLTDWNSAVVGTTTELTPVLTPNSDIALVPNGSGGLLLAMPTPGNPSGGNARGANAVDLQINRSAAAQVASGANSIILAGSDNSATATAAIAGGQGTTASSTAAVAVGILTAASGTAAFTYGSAASASGIEAAATGSQAGGATQGSSTVAVSSTATGSRAFGMAEDATTPAEIGVGDAVGAEAYGYATGGSIVASDFAHGSLAAGQIADAPNGGVFTFASAAEARGYVADENSFLYSAGVGAKAFGTAVNGGGLASDDSAGAIVHGASIGGLLYVTADSPGAEVAGIVDATSQISAEAAAAKAIGSCSGGFISATGEASLARGTAFNGSIQAAGVGSSAAGFASDTGFIVASGTGADASGFINGVDSNSNGGFILASGDGSRAHGIATGGGSISATGSSAIATGAATAPAQNIEATADNTTSQGPGAASRQFGVHAKSAGAFSVPGDAQTLEFRLRAVTDGSGPVNLTIDGTTPPRLDQLSCAWTYWLQVTGISTDNIAYIHSEILQGAARQDATGDGFIVAGPVRTALANASGSSIGNPNIPGVSPNFLVPVSSGISPATNMRWYGTLIISQVGAPLAPELVAARKAAKVAMLPRKGNSKLQARKLVLKAPASPKPQVSTAQIKTVPVTVTRKTAGSKKPLK